MYVLYLTPLYALSLERMWLHVLLHVHFVLAGTLFVWSIAGPDPAPHRPSRPVRLAVLFAATAAHALLAKIMYGYGYPRGTGAGVEEIRAAAKWMYYGGDLAELALAALFFAGWLRRPSKPSRRRLRDEPVWSARPWPIARHVSGGR